jgi:hypothetical protein
MCVCCVLTTGAAFSEVPGFDALLVDYLTALARERSPPAAARL